jgi:phage-related protein
MAEKNKPLAWIGSSKKDLMGLPLEVRKFFGHALDFAQRGDKHDTAKVLKGFGGAGGYEHYSRKAKGSRGACQGVMT